MGAVDRLYSVCLMLEREQYRRVRRILSMVCHMLADGVVDDAPRDLGRRQLQPDRACGPGAPVRLDGARAGCAGRPDGARHRPDVGPRAGDHAGRSPRLGARVVLVGRARRGSSALRPRRSRAASARTVPDRRRRHGSPRVRARRGRTGSWRRSGASTCWSTTPARSTRRGARAPDGIEATFALLVVGPFALEAGCSRCSAARPARGSSRSPRAGCTRSAAASTTSQYRARRLLRAAGVRPGEAGAGGARCASGRGGRRGGVAFTAMHPGWADTPGLAESLPGFYRVDAAAAADPGPGRGHHRLARDPSGPGRDRRPAVPGPAAAARSTGCRRRA